MAFILYNQSTDKDRIRTLKYPHRPLIEDYFPSKITDKFSMTFIHMYKNFPFYRKGWNWKLFTRIIDQLLETEDLDDPNLYYMANLLLNLLYEFHCKDMDCVTGIVAAYFRHKIMNEEDNSCVNEYLLRNDRHVEYHDNFISSAIDKADVKYLSILVRYGLKLKLADNEYKSAKSTVKRLVTWLSYEYHFTFSLVCAYDNVANFLGIKRKFWRRKFNAIKAFDAVMRKRNGCRTLPMYIECITLYWESVPTPFLTKREMKFLVLKLLSGQNIPQMEDLAEELSDEFIELFPDITSQNFYSPRKLQHLCRCKIRSIIAPGKSLPICVTKLFEERHISEEMIKYLMCNIPSK